MKWKNNGKSFLAWQEIIYANPIIGRQSVFHSITITKNSRTEIVIKVNNNTHTHKHSGVKFTVAD